MGDVTRISNKAITPPESQVEQATPGLPTEPFYGHPGDSFEADAGRASTTGEGQRTGSAALYGEVQISPEQGEEIDKELSMLGKAINELKDKVPADQLKASSARLAEAMTIRWAHHLAAKFISQMHKSETTT